MKKIFLFLSLSIFLFSCSFQDELKNARDNARIMDMKLIEGQAQLYYMDNGKYPKNIDYPIFPTGSKGESCEPGYNYKVNSDNSCYIVSTCFEDESNIEKKAKYDGGLDDALFELGNIDCFK